MHFYHQVIPCQQSEPKQNNILTRIFNNVKIVVVNKIYYDKNVLYIVKGNRGESGILFIKSRMF